MSRLGISTATVFVHQGTPIPAWLENGGAEISLGHLDDVSPSRLGPGPIICQVVIHFAQVNFDERGSTVIRHSGSGVFKPLFPSGTVLAVTNPKGELVLNRHLCRLCYKNTGRFERDSNRRKVILCKGEEEAVYQFHCPNCGFRWGVSLPNSNGDGIGNGHSHKSKHQTHRR
ncbi:MAG: hypothetical protein AAB738_01925 [Patescibacteria group bacterium]